MNKENTIDTDSVFIKRSELELKEEKIPINCVLSKSEVFNMIPDNVYAKPNKELEKTKVEMRWRIFKFPNKKNDIVEISFKKLNGKRMYINKSGNWIEKEVSNIYDEFVIREYYHYTD